MGELLLTDDLWVACTQKWAFFFISTLKIKSILSAFFCAALWMASFSWSVVHSLACKQTFLCSNCGLTEMEVALLGKCEDLYRPYCRFEVYILCLLQQNKRRECSCTRNTLAQDSEDTNSALTILLEDAKAFAVLLQCSNKLILSTLSMKLESSAPF